MKKHLQKRRCQRFEIPQASIQYKKTGSLAALWPVNGKGELINISKGGMCFICCENISANNKLMINLNLPDGDCLVLKGTVAWKGLWSDTCSRVGIQFAGFNNKKGWYNSMEVLDKLRLLEEHYLYQYSDLKRVA